VRLALSFDLSPLRPWEWSHLAGSEAERWLEAVAIVNAVREGQAAAHEEKAGWERSKAKMDA
jgi:hypothetical protein